MARAQRLSAVAIAVLVTLAPRTAMAHAQLEESSPTNNETVHESVRVVELRFNEEVSFPRIVVRLASGKVVTGSMARRRNSDIAAFVPSRPLQRGTYRVQWKAQSADGHWVSGSLRFVVT